ncbi:MAG TPA: redoxin domain-containing protein, partial [Bacteroidia bacterium]|nr:redoxin domain-containing protein [Bacteroidia bacterium]
MRFPLLLVVSLYFQVPGSVKAQVIHRMSFDGMEQRLHGISDSLVVLNFWATWCKPCVEELPYFDSA